MLIVIRIVCPPSWPQTLLGKRRPTTTSGVLPGLAGLGNARATRYSRREIHHRCAQARARRPMATKIIQEKERVVVRFAGDSGDGMQLTGDRFTNATALLGNDLATLPDFPAEIRAPAGTLAGVSA